MPRQLRDRAREPGADIEFHASCSFLTVRIGATSNRGTDIQMSCRDITARHLYSSYITNIQTHAAPPKYVPILYVGKNGSRGACNIAPSSGSMRCSLPPRPVRPPAWDGMPAARRRADGTAPDQVQNGIKSRNSTCPLTARPPPLAGCGRRRPPRAPASLPTPRGEAPR